MAVYRANTKEDGYCYDCREEDSCLVQCEKCKNWFCTKHIQSVDDLQSPTLKKVNLCDKNRGQLSIF